MLMKRLGWIPAGSALFVAGLLAGCGGGSSAGGGAMYVEACTLSCTNGVGGTQVSCGVLNTFQNQEIAVLFSQSADITTVSKQSFQVIDAATGNVPVGSYLLDPSNPRRVIFRPQLDFDLQGNPIYGFAAGATYEVKIPGTAQADLPPFIESTAGKRNESRLLCTITTDQGISDPVPGPPKVKVFVDTIDPITQVVTPGVLAYDDLGNKNLTDVSLNTKITMVFDDLMNKGTLVVGAPPIAPFITIAIDPDGNTSDPSDQVVVQGNWLFHLDQLALQTTVVFTPSNPFPGAGAGAPLNPRKIVVNMPPQIKDLKGNSLLNTGAAVLTPVFLASQPVVLPPGGEQFTNTALRDTPRTGADWGETTPGRLAPGSGGGSGRLGDLEIQTGETVTLHTGPVRATGRIQWNQTPLNGDMITFTYEDPPGTINTTQFTFLDCGGSCLGFIESDPPLTSLTLSYLIHAWNASPDPAAQVASLSLEDSNTLLITMNSPGVTGTLFTFDASPSAAINFESGPTLNPLDPNSPHLLTDGFAGETFAAGNLIDNSDFQPGGIPGPGGTPPDIFVGDGVFEFAKIDIASGGVLRLEGPNAARVFARGTATVLGTINVAGGTPIAHRSDIPLGQLGGRPGPFAGEGGKGGDRPDNSGTDLIPDPVLSPPSDPLSQGIPNPGAFIQGRPGRGIGNNGTVAAGPEGSHYPPQLPTSQSALGDLETDANCVSEQVAGPGGGGAYAVDGGIGVALAFNPTSMQGGSNTPPPTSGGDATAAGLEPPGSPPIKRKLTPDKGYLRGGSGGGGGGAHVQMTQTNGGGIPDPCVSPGALIPIPGAYFSHSGAAGGGGGGAIQLQAGRNVHIGGLLDASGGDGGSSNVGQINGDSAAPGGAGSGGATLIQSQTITFGPVQHVSIAGGLGGLGVTGSLGGFGGTGLARVETKVPPQQSAVAPSIDPFDPLDPTNSLAFLSVGPWLRSRELPASFQGAQSCWIKPSAAFFSMTFNDDVAGTLGWDMDLILNLGAGPVTRSYRDPTQGPAMTSWQAFWGELIDRDLTSGTGAPLIVRFQGAKLVGTLNNPCLVPISGPTSPILPGSLTPWVRHPVELNGFNPAPDMIRFTIIFDANKATEFSKILGVTNLRVNAQGD
jgi:hypothetical protein